jgi:archaellum component FlaC
MLYKPTLRLDRLVVIKDQRLVYDESFHSGVNIIRGENGSGKSTIADLIFFALGGENASLKREALLCDFVYAQVLINGEGLTLRRPISSTEKRPISIYWDSLDKALQAPEGRWETYPYAARENRESFSTVLFRAMGLPPTEGEMSSRITMHQILRLMYVDQHTSYDRIFRYEDFDSAVTREAVGAFLCGFYDPVLYDLKLNIRELENEHSFISKELKTILEVLGPSAQGMTVSFLEQELHNRTAEREKVVHSLQQIADGSVDLDDVATELAAAREELQDALAAARERARTARDRVEQLEFEVADSAEFIEALSRKIVAARDATTVHSMLGFVQFDFCPACYHRLTQADEHACHVCRSPLDGREGQSHLLRMQNELALQLSESGSLQEQRLKDLNTARNDLAPAQAEVAGLHRRLLGMTLPSPSGSAVVAAELNQRLGYLGREIEDVERRLTVARRIEGLSDRKAEIAAELSKIRDEIEARSANERERRTTAKATVSELTRELINHDLSREEGFANVGVIDFDFAENRVSVDGRMNFAASSMVFLKNSFHLAILLASTKHEFFRYPRFTLFDNIEDKGMEPKRSHRFQHLVVERSQKIEVEHQIILTTSMIAPELDTPELTVGPFYTHDLKSLAISASR